MRQGQHHDVVTRERVGGGRLDDPVGQRHELRMVLAQAAAGRAGRGQRADLDLGMTEEQPQQLATGVAARARDTDPDAHGLRLLHTHD